MKRMIKSVTQSSVKANNSYDRYYEKVKSKGDNDDIDYGDTLGGAMMSGIEVLDIFEDDNATTEELAQAVVDYVDEYYFVTPSQLNWVYNEMMKEAWR